MKKRMLVATGLLVLGLMTSCGAKEESKAPDPEPVQEATAPEPEQVQEDVQEAPAETWINKIEARYSEEHDKYKEDLGETLGVAGKDIASQNPTFYKNVRDDKTGKWRMAVIATDTNVINYALSAWANYWDEDCQLLIIENLKHHCAVITDLGFCLEVRLYEYVDGEEHYAATIGSGKPLGQFWVFFDGESYKVPTE